MKTIFNSLKGFSSVAIILIALGIIAVGSGIYFLTSPTQPTQPTQQITNVPEESLDNIYPIITPSVQEENQPTATPTITNPIESPTALDVSNLSLVYKLSKRERAGLPKGFSIVLYDPIQKTRQVIKESEIGQIDRIRKDISPDRYFYYTYYDDYSQSLIKSDLSGKTLDAIAIFITEQLAISQNRQKLAWCQRDGTLAIYDFSTEHIKNFKDDFVCLISMLNSAFSKDGSKFYYASGLYEVYGDYTDEEMEEMRRKAQVGLHSIDLLTGKSTYITSSLPILFWNDSAKINLQQKIAINLKDPSGDIIEVKKLNNTNFDYLTPEQLNQLPTIAKLQSPARNYAVYELSLDGRGILYDVRFDDGREELGYFDIASGKNYFPIPNINLNKNEYLASFIAINKDLIFYTIIKSDGGIESTKLYKTTVNGQNELVDSVIGGIGFIDIVKK